MDEGFCPNCMEKTLFEKQDKSKYICQTCNGVFKKCKKQNCYTMLSKKEHIFCAKCSESEIKGKHGAKVLVAVGGALALAGRVAWKNKDKIIKGTTKIASKIIFRA